MKLRLLEQEIEVPENTLITRPPVAPAAQTFAQAACEAMDHPLDKPPLGAWDMKGKKVAVLVDDWGRPTPCSEFLPEVLKRLRAAGAAYEEITIVTASGMHEPMDDADLLRKVGPEAFTTVRCVSHDGGNPEQLAYCGITPLGTPVWINRYVTQADIRIALGRIYPHGNYGYEGGYKMIVPGVSSFETILRDHSLNFSPLSTCGVLDGNPSRAEADAVGAMVGIDFLVNFVIDWDARPVKAFGGTVESVFSAGVDYGQRRVWAATTGGKRADITLLCHREMGDLSLSNNPSYYVGLAKGITREGGIVISTMQYMPGKRCMVQGVDLDALSIGELLRLHEKRDWNLSPREIQHIIKTIRGAFYRRRELECRPQPLYLTCPGFPYALLQRWNATQFDGIQAALDAATAVRRDPVIVVIPDAKHTLPLVEYSFAAGGGDRGPRAQ